MHVVAIIWTFNPNIELFVKVLSSIVNQVDHTIIVDNGSINVHIIMDNCKKITNVTVVRLNANLGVHALNLGINYTIKKFNPDYILILDQDTIVYPNALKKIISKLKSCKYNKIIGVACLSGNDVEYEWKGKLIAFFKNGIFSGCLINSDVIKRKRILIRSELFIDQADFDFYERIRRRGFITVFYGEKLIEHKLGTELNLELKLPILGSIKCMYEPPQRYYYIVRNSTVLLFEKKIDIVRYLGQVFLYFCSLMLIDGIRTAIKAFILGLAHGLFRKLGYFDYDIFSKE